MSSKAETQVDYVSTSQAARMLGVSVGTVQQMVENGELVAWKTVGGHRRIDQASVMLRMDGHKKEFVKSQHQTSMAYTQPHRKLSILVAEDDPLATKIYEHTFAPMHDRIDVAYAKDGIEALLHLGQHPTDLLVLDLDIPHVNGYEMLRKIKNNKDLTRLCVLIVTGSKLEQNDLERPELTNVNILSKPLDRSFLRGYIAGFLDVSQKKFGDI
ncbi:response regulator [Aliidiomarina halalkaliphila]|uniref:Response regulator n=1 Tax=Aliidiomarina halalkaliphila TaxID=2593535 RepID=A0A552X5C2_9GAMM|nr:response regulator [Aliidiomarina halalkaliphila]TRW50214.1 response regulator [Aliidiomarina halalkaliphila]